MKNAKNQIYEVGRKTRKVQIGYRERMLCAECESLLSKYEREFKKVWIDTIPPDFEHVVSNPSADVITVALSNYDTFKLFHLSVFWRAAVSQGFAAGRISLGPYQDYVAGLIRQGDPGRPGDVPFLGVLVLDDDKRPVSMITHLATGEGRFEGKHHYYMMSYAFCDWMFIMARPGPQWMVRLEERYRQENVFLLATVRHRQSKSFMLAAETIRRFRQRGPR